MPQLLVVKAVVGASVCCVAGFALAGCSASAVQHAVSGSQHHTNSYSVPGPVQSLVLDGQVGNVNVTGSGSGGVSVTEHISYDHTAPQTTHAASGGTLTLNSSCPSNDACGVSYDIQAPRAAAVKISENLGVIKLASLSGQVTVHTNGTVNLSSLSGQADVSSDTGTISGTNLSSSRATLHSTAGTVDVTFSAAPDSITATTNVGSVTVRVPGNVSYKVDAHSSVGSTKISVSNNASSSHAITATANWTAPGILEALIPGRMRGHVGTAEVP